MLRYKVFKQPVKYLQMLKIQQDLVANYKEPLILLLQHKPCFTVGRRNTGRDIELIELQKKLEGLGAEFIYSKRGGDITFHGPGQLVVYPILDLKSIGLGVKQYVDLLQGAIQETCADFQVDTILTSDYGVWVTETRKVCAIGIQVQRHITSHGFALNCDNDLSWFKKIVPCGLKGKTATSLTAEKGKVLSVDMVVPKLLDRLSSKLQMKLIDLKNQDPNLDKVLDEISA